MKPKRYSSWINVPLAASMRQQIEEIATVREMAMSEVVREILTEGLKTRGLVA